MIGAGQPAGRRGAARYRVLGSGLCALLLILIAFPGTARAQRWAWPSEPPPRPLAAREMTFPPYEVRTLSNGMQVVAVLHHEQPAVSLRLLVRVGSAQNPPGKQGIAALMASLLDQGTATLSAEEIADTIDTIGGAMGTGSGSDLTFVNAVVMKDSFGAAMDLVADVVRHPAFSPEEIERQRQQTLSGMQVSQSDPDYVASVAFDRLVYGFHPYGLPGRGTPESLAGITGEDLRAFHRRYFVPNNMILAVVGDLTTDEAFSTAEQAFGGWPRGEVPSDTFAEPPPPTRRVIVIDKPDAVQTEIRVGHLGIPRKHDDYMAVDLAIKILGGEGANRLHRVLRSERGLTYGAAADTRALKQAGSFVADTDTRTETTGEALRLMVDEFAKLRRERVGSRELADAQAYLAGNFPLTTETPDAIATKVLNALFYELPVEEISAYPRLVQAVTPDDVQRVARAFVFPDRLSIVLVGNAAAFRSQLKAAGFPDYEVIPLEDVDLSSASLRRTAKPTGASGGLVGPRLTAARTTAYTAGPAVVAARTTAYTAAQVVAAARTTAYTAAHPRSDFETVTHTDDRAVRATSRRSSVAADPHARTRPAGGRMGSSPIARASGIAAPDRTDGAALLDRVVRAKGGLDVLRAVRTLVANATTTLRMEGRALPSETTTRVVYPDRFRVDATVPGGTVTQVYSAGAAWVEDPGGIHDAPVAMRDEIAASVGRDMIPMVAAADGRRTVRQLPEEGRDGHRYRVLEIGGDGPASVRLYVDSDGLVARQHTVATGPGGESLEVEELFSDYRPVEGVLMPFRAELRHNGQPVLDRVLTTVTLNADLELALFEKPRE